MPFLLEGHNFIFITLHIEADFCLWVSMIQYLYMSWASRRQFKYFSIFFLVVAFILFIIIYPLIFKDPTCADGKKNGDESGVDCGGSCSTMCMEEVSKPVVLWSRAFKVVNNNYNLVAFVENRNKTSGVVEAPYEFRIYNTDNKLIGRKEGKTFIPPNQQFAVFESRFDAGQESIKSVTFEFTDEMSWVKKFPIVQLLPITVKDISLNNNTDTPTLQATVVNDSVYPVSEFDVIAILYDENKNAINVSKTHKSGLQKGSKMQITFTWPESLLKSPVTKDVLISINPFSFSL